MMKVLLVFNVFFNICILFSVSLIIFCRLKGQNELVVGGENSPTSIFIQIPSGGAMWLWYTLLLSGVIYTVMTVFMLFKIKA